MELFQYLATIWSEHRDLILLVFLGWFFSGLHVLWYINTPLYYRLNGDGEFYTDMMSRPVLYLSRRRIFWFFILAPITVVGIFITIINDN